MSAIVAAGRSSSARDRGRPVAGRVDLRRLYELAPGRNRRVRRGDRGIRRGGLHRAVGERCRVPRDTCGSGAVRWRSHDAHVPEERCLHYDEAVEMLGSTGGHRDGRSERRIAESYHAGMRSAKAMMNESEGIRATRRIDLATATELTQQLRVDSIRCSTGAGSGHPTSSMSAADILAVLVRRHLRYGWDRPKAEENAHLIFSKRHASPLLYSV